MAALLDSSKQIKLWLSERGLHPEDIRRGMKLLLRSGLGNEKSFRTAREAPGSGIRRSR